jgi:hypothetical protein
VVVALILLIVVATVAWFRRDGTLALLQRLRAARVPARG